MDFPIEHGDFHSYVKLPEGKDIPPQKWEAKKPLVEFSRWLLSWYPWCAFLGWVYPLWKSYDGFGASPRAFHVWVIRHLGLSQDRLAPTSWFLHGTSHVSCIVCKAHASWSHQHMKEENTPRLQAIKTVWSWKWLATGGCKLETILVVSYKWGSPQMAGLWWKILSTWMTRGVPPFKETFISMLRVPWILSHSPGGKGAFDTDVGRGLSTVPGSSVINTWRSLENPRRSHGEIMEVYSL